MSRSLEEQLLSLLRSDPSRTWGAREIEEALGWDEFCPHPKNNQLAACVSRKLESDGMVIVISKSVRGGPYDVKLVTRP